MLVDNDDVPAVVVDPGAYRTKAGFSGEPTPRVALQSDVGRDTVTHALHVGLNELLMKRDQLEIAQPLLSGTVDDWDQFEALLLHAVCKQLGTTGSLHPLLVALPAYSDRVRKERTLEICFEKLGCPAVFEAKSAALAAFAVGHHTALVVDSGHAVTSVTPVHEGYALLKACVWSTKAGHQLSSELLQLLEARPEPIRPRFAFSRKRLADGRTELVLNSTSRVHPSYTRWAQMEVVDAIKETQFYVAESSGTDPSSVVPQKHTLPDGTVVTIGPERMCLPELLFTESGGPALPDSVLASIQKCDHDIRQLLAKATVVTGGTSLVEGFLRRLEKEVAARAPSIAKVRPPIALASAADRKNTTWLGGSILASLGAFQPLWISALEYQESGAAIVHKKCP